MCAASINLLDLYRGIFLPRGAREDSPTYCGKKGLKKGIKGWVSFSGDSVGLVTCTSTPSYYYKIIPSLTPAVANKRQRTQKSAFAPPPPPHKAGGSAATLLELKFEAGQHPSGFFSSRRRRGLSRSEERDKIPGKKGRIRIRILERNAKKI